MQFKVLAVSAFAASAVAQIPTAIGTITDLVSLLSVLQTALPSSLVAEGLTNSNAVISQVSSEFAAGETPTWFSDLPSDIKSYIGPTDMATAAAGNMTAMGSNATAIATSAIYNSTAVSAGQSSILASISAANSSINSVAANPTMTGGPSQTGSSGASASSGSSGSSSTSSAGAVPTAVVGMGLAGAVGLVGLFAL